MLYYFYAFGQLAAKNKPIVFSVPSGNYGNLTAGVIAKRMGLPIAHFLAATNANDIIPEYLNTGIFKPKKSIETISNAMDVGNPSNFTRLQALFNSSLADFRSEITGYSYSDSQTRESILKIYNEFGYVADPHGAIGYMAMDEYLNEHDVIGVFLETAHPVKFGQEVTPIVGYEIPLPKSIGERLKAPMKSSPCSSEYKDFIGLVEKLLAG